MEFDEIIQGQHEERGEETIKNRSLRDPNREKESRRTASLLWNPWKYNQPGKKTPFEDRTTDT